MSSHLGCKDDLPLKRPTRLIDMGDDDQDSLRVVQGETLTDNDHYAYLCYTRGFTSCLAFPVLFHPNYLQGFPRDALPPTMEDGLRIIQACGLRYVWVETLCIVQGDEEDERQETSRQSQYLQGAAFVLAAASSEGNLDGMLAERVPPLHNIGTVQFVPPSSPALSCGLHLRRPLQSATEATQTMLRRAWASSELVLSRRLVAWGADQVHWTCRTCLRSEGSTAVGNPSWTRYLPPPARAPNLPNGIARAHFMWYTLVELYSGSTAFRFWDRLAAVERYANFYSAHSISSSYLSGLWEDDVANGLLWYVTDLMNTRHPSTFHLAPSWSWASAKGSVSYTLLHGVRMDRIIDERHRVCLESYTRSGLEFRSFTQSRITLRAMTLSLATRSEASVQKVPEGQFFLDSYSPEKRDGKRVLMFIAPWGAGDLGISSSNDMRCIGLVLLNRSPDEGVDHWIRIGLFLGLHYDGVLDGWTRQTLTIQ